jgi:hypothetical protein
MEFPFNTEKSIEKSHLRPLDFASTSTPRKSPQEPPKITGKTRLQAVGFNGSRVVSHGFSSFTNDRHQNWTSGHSRVLHDRPKIGLVSTGIALPRRILVLATGIAHLGRRVTAFSRFVSLPLNLSWVLSLPSASLPQQISLYLRFSFSPNLSVSSLCLYSLTLSVRVLGGRKKKKELKEERR